MPVQNSLAPKKNVPAVSASSVNPFSGSVPDTKGKAVAGALQTRAASETQAAVFMAKQFPRNQADAFERVVIACERESLAVKAVYCYQRGGTDITGPSIRLAEALAAAWGNIDCGIVEVDRNDDESTIQAYAWDLETNFRSVKTFTVPHVRDTKHGSKKLTDGRDIYEHVANNGARRLRSCILAVIPGDVVDAAVDQCNKTLEAKADTSPENLKKLCDAFAKIGVSKEMIEGRIQRKIDAMRPAQLVNLRNIFNSIKDGMSEPADWFEASETALKPAVVPEKSEPVSPPNPQDDPFAETAPEPTEEEFKLTSGEPEDDQASPCDAISDEIRAATAKPAFDRIRREIEAGRKNNSILPEEADALVEALNKRVEHVRGGGK